MTELIEKYTERILIDYPEKDKIHIDLKDMITELSSPKELPSEELSEKEFDEIVSKYLKEETVEFFNQEARKEYKKKWFNIVNDAYKKGLSLPPNREEIKEEIDLFNHYQEQLNNLVSDYNDMVDKKDNQIILLTKQLEEANKNMSLLKMNMDKLLTYDSTDNYSKGLIKSLLKTINTNSNG